MVGSMHGSRTGEAVSPKAAAVAETAKAAAFAKAAKTAAFAKPAKTAATLEAAAAVPAAPPSQLAADAGPCATCTHATYIPDTNSNHH